MTRSTCLYLLLGLVLLAVALALALPRLRREQVPAGRGLFSVDRTNFFPSPSGTDPCRTRLYPTELAGGRQCPGDREIRRRETTRREERP